MEFSLHLGFTRLIIIDNLASRLLIADHVTAPPPPAVTRDLSNQSSDLCHPPHEPRDSPEVIIHGLEEEFCVGSVHDLLEVRQGDALRGHAYPDQVGSLLLLQVVDDPGFLRHAAPTGMLRLTWLQIRPPGHVTRPLHHPHLYAPPSPEPRLVPGPVPVQMRRFQLQRAAPMMLSSENSQYAKNGHTQLPMLIFRIKASQKVESM